MIPGSTSSAVSSSSIAAVPHSFVDPVADAMMDRLMAALVVNHFYIVLEQGEYYSMKYAAPVASLHSVLHPKVNCSGQLMASLASTGIDLSSLFCNGTLLATSQPLVMDSDHESHDDGGLPPPVEDRAQSLKRGNPSCCCSQTYKRQ